MDHMRILKRAWNILWGYRALWILGFLLALTTAGGAWGSSGGGGGSHGSGGSGGTGGSGGPGITLPPDVQRELENIGNWFTQVFSPENLPTIIGIIIGVVVFFLLLGFVFAAIHYIVQTGVIRMVDGYEGTGERLSWRQGWRLGWSRAAWKLFLVDLLLFVPVFVAFIILFGCAALPVLLSILANAQPGAASIIATIGLAFLVTFLAILVGVVISLLRELAYRQTVLGGRGPVEAIREGWLAVRSRFKDVGILWLILLGINIGFGLALAIVGFFLVALGLISGGGIGAVLFFIARAISGTVAGAVTAAIGGGLVFLLVLAIPLTFLRGLKLVYESSAWTLAYRELNVPAEA